LCGQVCPTGAIQRISIEEKTGTGPFAKEGPIKLGTAFFDRGRCLPWAMETPCGVCEHECPVTDEAAIRVTAIGETRSRDRRLLMDGGVTSAVMDLEKRQR